MIHIDLFSGIGGFSLAVDSVFDNIEHVFCEIDPFCQQVIKKNFGKDSIIYGDIRELTSDSYKSRRIHRESEKQSAEGHNKTQCESFTSIESPFLLTGGFPCQPFSQAGKRRGTTDNRYLWPEMLRVIRVFHPTWVVAENVRGLLTIEQGMVFEQVCLDLEREGYEVQPFIVPAVAVNAPHRRDRVWFVANRNDRGQKVKELKAAGNQQCDRGGISSHGSSTRLEGQLSESGQDGRYARQAAESGSGFSGWEENWLEVATELCGVDDGLPTRMDGFKLSKSKHRVERLKSLGNSIVPQVAIEIMKAIRGTL